MELIGLFFKPGRRSRAGAGGRTKPTPCQTVLFNVITAVFFYTLVNEPSKVKANVVFGVPPPCFSVSRAVWYGFNSSFFSALQKT